MSTAVPRRQPLSLLHDTPPRLIECSFWPVKEKVVREVLSQQEHHPGEVKTTHVMHTPSASTLILFSWYSD